MSCIQPRAYAALRHAADFRRRRRVTSRTCCLLAAGLLISGAPARASFIVYDGNVPQTDENVLLNNNSVGTTIQGNLNNSGAPVTFTSPTQFLAAPSNGQARVEARSANDINASQVDVDDSIIVGMGNANDRILSLIFNAFTGTGSLSIIINGYNPDNSPANATITVDDDSDPLTLGNGSNFYTVVATGGMTIATVEIKPNANSSYTDLRQVRLGAIPEPGSVALAAVGLALAAAGRRRLG